MNHTATYSPEDNKLRLYPACRLDAEEYARVKAAGFSWAPRQELFVAPAWTPEREDLLIEMCGEIGDEDTSLVERAADRAERFEELKKKRAADAHRERAAVASITDNIPLGQPILVGHHSERHARRDAERIENGMRRAVQLWRTSRYWQDRAAGAIRNAKYKECPDVRARRIKGLEADLRKQKRRLESAEHWIGRWSRLFDAGYLPLKNGQGESTPIVRARYLSDRDGVYQPFPLDKFPRELPASQYEGDMGIYTALYEGIITPEQAQEISLKIHNAMKASAERWIEHITNRLEYERAMLAAAGGTVSDRVKPEKGGAVQCWASPAQGDGWSFVTKVNKISVSIEDNWGNGGVNFPRTIPFDKLQGVMSKEQVESALAAGRATRVDDGTGFILHSDVEQNAQLYAERMQVVEREQAEDAQFDGLADTLRQGVQVVTAPTLFTTPPEIADRMVDLLDPVEHDVVLEPSAGTGRLIEALLRRGRFSIAAVEVNMALFNSLKRFNPFILIQSDFLSVKPGRCGIDDTASIVNPFRYVIMNPPFDRGADIKHILHALTFLEPGGRLVALCANGPRQQEKLMPLADRWEPLPENSFKEAGTGVSVAMMLIVKEAC